MRHLGLCLALLVVLGVACGPRTSEPFPPPLEETYTPAAPSAEATAAATVPPASLAASPEAALPPEVQKAAEESLELLWSNPRRFYDEALLEDRRKEAPFEVFEPALVENVVRPTGSLKGLRSIPSSMFELAQGYLQTYVQPEGQKALEESRKYGNDLHRAFFALDLEKGDVLAAVLLVPEGQGGFKVQSLVLKSRTLGVPLTVEKPPAREAVLRFLDLVRQGRGKVLYEEYTSPGMRAELPLARLDQAVAELRADLVPEGQDPDAMMVGAQRWYSSEGWTQTYEYALAGRQGTVRLNINLLEKGFLMSGVSWVVERPQASPSP